MTDPNRRALSQPWAERAQADTTPADYQLTDLARLLHSSARWWWGVKREPGRGTPEYYRLPPATRHRINQQGPTAYAQCFLCGVTITTFGSASFLPERSRQHILDHRQSEQVRRLLNQATHATGGTGREAHTPEVSE